MRRYLLSTILFVSLPVFSVSAQNYIPSNGYSGAGVIVNMDVLSAPSSGGAAPIVLSQPLSPPLRPQLTRPMPSAPVRNLTPPVAMRAPVAPLPPVEEIVKAAPVASQEKKATTHIPNYISPIAALPSTDKSVDYNRSDLAADKVAPPPKPLNDLLSDEPSSVSKKEVKAAIIDSGMIDARTPSAVSAPAPSAMRSGRQELGSMHDELPEVITDEKSSPAIQVDEMAPVKTSSNDPVMPPALPSPIAQKNNDIQTAMLEPTPIAKPAESISSPDGFEAYRLLFDGESADLKPSETAILDKVVARMNADTTSRLQVRAYANGTPETSSAARRLSLKRAMAVREYMMRKKIVGTRLDIRALGSGSAEMGDEVGRSNAPSDRVDVVFAR